MTQPTSDFNATALSRYRSLLRLGSIGVQQVPLNIGQGLRRGYVMEYGHQMLLIGSQDQASLTSSGGHSRNASRKAEMIVLAGVDID